jgi:hypothetical protein
LQPTRRAGKNSNAKVQRNSEQTIGYADASKAVRARRAVAGSCSGGIENLKLEIICAIGRVGAVVQTALIGERRALRDCLM